MAFTRPTVTVLRDRIATDINARLPGADSRLRRSALEVLSVALAGVVHGLYGYLDWLARQVMVDSAETEHLDRHATVWGVLRKAAARAAGTATATGNDGVEVPAGTLLQAGETQYLTTAAAVVAAGSASLPIEAVDPGAGGNAAAGVLLLYATPVAGIDGSATVVLLEGGADAEIDGDLRQRVLDRIRQPPHGGAAHDYVAWALEVPGVTRAWLTAGEMGLGTITLRFLMDDLRVDGIPLGDARPLLPTLDIKVMQDYIDAVDRRPVTADVFAAAPEPVALDVTVDNLQPNTAEVQAAVTAEIADMIKRVAAPGATIPLSKIWEAVSIASGEASHTITAPAADVTHTAGQMAIPGSVTFT